MIMVVSALSSLFYHWGILPWIIKQLSKLFVRTLKINGPLGFGASATIFLGTVEAPLLIRPYLLTMSRSDLFALITCTMATIAGTVMVIYASIVGQIVPNAFTHMLVASLVSIPAALMISKTLIPDRTDNKVTLSDISSPPRQTKGAMDAVIKGTLDGLDMVLKIAAIIIVLFSLVYLTNHFLAIIPAGEKPFTVEGIVGTVLRPFLWLIGIPWEETQIASQLMGSKIILNEFVAYIQMSKLPEGALSGKTSLIMTYALCGFANLGSVGIVIGGLGTLLPERSEEIIELCLKSLVSGNLATLMTAGVVGLMS
jgi:CNT family concentrative nucleoside transporter